jgi:nucleotide-binding universal stress UspA family protein
MISKILVATDGSKTSQNAIKYAIGLAGQTNATIALLTVIDDSTVVAAQYVPSEFSSTQIVEPIAQYLRSAAEKYLKRAKGRCEKSGITCNWAIRNGHPVEEILREAKKLKADLIVIGSHGKGTLEYAVLGSVAYGVIHKNTKYPVLVIRK